VTLSPTQRAYAWGYGATIGNHAWRLVLLTVLANAREAGPGKVVYDRPAAELADHCEMSLSGTRKAVKGLADAGVIRVVHRPPDGDLLFVRYDREQPNLTAEGAA
jgi:hypothetical protein